MQVALTQALTHMIAEAVGERSVRLPAIVGHGDFDSWEDFWKRIVDNVSDADEGRPKWVSMSDIEWRGAVAAVILDLDCIARGDVEHMRGNHDVAAPVLREAMEALLTRTMK